MSATAQTFTAKTDYFGLGDSPLKIESSDENKSASVAELADECGDVANYNVYGEYAAPSCGYALKASLADKTAKLGGLTTVGKDAAARKFMLTQVEIATSAGQAPTVSTAMRQRSISCIMRRYFSPPLPWKAASSRAPIIRPAASPRTRRLTA